MRARGEEAIARARSALRAGRVILYPTDTLWGLGADPTSRSATQRLLELKERPSGTPLSVAFSSVEEIEPYAELTRERRSLLRRHLPGPYTFLLPARPEAARRLAPAVLGPAHRLGVRVPDHPGARRLLAQTGPITSTSANRHGEPPVSSVAEARTVFGDRLGAYVALPPAPCGRPSTLVDLTGRVPREVPR